MSEELEMITDGVDSDQAEAYVEAFYSEDDEDEEEEEAEYLGDSEQEDIDLYSLYGDNSSCNTPLVHNSQLDDPAWEEDDSEDEGEGKLENLAAEGTGVNQHMTSGSRCGQKGNDSEGALSGDQEP